MALMGYFGIGVTLRHCSRAPWPNREGRPLEMCAMKANVPDGVTPLPENEDKQLVLSLIHI